MYNMIRIYLKEALNKIKENAVDIHTEYPLEKFDIK